VEKSLLYPKLTARIFDTPIADNYFFSTIMYTGLAKIIMIAIIEKKRV